MEKGDSVQKALRLLHYSRQWLEYGFVTGDFLSEQVKVFKTGEDPHREHYRYAAFRRVLSDRASLTQEEIEHYVELAQRDEDFVMAEAALVDLVHWSGLTSEQFEHLCFHPAFESPYLQKRIAQKRLLTEVERTPLTPSLFEKYLMGQDREVQECLIRSQFLTLEQWQVLSERGVTRAIRNRAKEHLPRPAKSKPRV